MNNQLDAQQLAKQAFAPIAAIWSNVDSADCQPLLTAVNRQHLLWGPADTPPSVLFS